MNERKQYSKYVQKGSFNKSFYLSEKEFEEIRIALRIGCKFQISSRYSREVPGKLYGWCPVDCWYYQENGLVYYLLTNDARRELVEFLDRKVEFLDRRI